MLAKNRSRHFWFVSVLLAALLTACGGGNQTDGPKSAPKAIEVGVVTVAERPLALQAELAGRTVASQIAEIRPQISGIVSERLFKEGSLVRAGQPLYQIDPASYQAAVDKAQAAVSRAQATLNAAELKARRQQELFAAEAGSRQEHEDAQAALLQARADLKSAQAALASARIDLSRTRVTAPIAGRIETSSVTAGALVTANQTAALTRVQQLDPMLVDIQQSSVEVLQLRRQLAEGKLKSGTLAIRLLLEDGSSYQHEGQLQVSGVTVNPTTGAVTLRAQVPNPDGFLLPGMYVRAVLDKAQDPAAILVPQGGILRNARGEASALIVDADGAVRRREVTVAETVQGQWRVTKGLKSGDRLIVEGTAKVREGQLVHAVAATKPIAAAGAADTAAAAASSVANH